MSNALVIIVLLGAQPSDPAATAWAPAMLSAARRALGPESTVLVDTSDTMTDEAALTLTERLGARAVVRVRWADAKLTRARLHVHVGTWADDELAFRPEDPAAEKGRSVGYALATMVQRLHHGAPAAPAAPPEQAPPPPPPGPVVVAPSAPARTRNDLDLFATGAVAAFAPSYGGAVGARYWATPAFGLRLAAGARLGTLSVADVATTAVFVATGPGVRIPLGARFELGARADVMVFRVAASRDDESRGTTVRSRVLGAFDASVEGAWTVVGGLALIGAAGTEIAFGSTDVKVGGRRVADIPPVRAVFEVGGRFRF